MGEKTKGTEFEKMLEAYQKNGQIPEDVDISRIMSQLKKQEEATINEALDYISKITSRYIYCLAVTVDRAQGKCLEDKFWEAAVKRCRVDNNRYTWQFEHAKRDLKTLRDKLQEIDNIVGLNRY